MSRWFQVGALVVFLSTSLAHAGLFSEIDILVREAAVAEVWGLYPEAELDQAFYDITYEVAEENLESCHFTLVGEIPLGPEAYEFVACVVAQSKADIRVTIINWVQRN